MAADDSEPFQLPSDLQAHMDAGGHDATTLQTALENDPALAVAQYAFDDAGAEAMADIRT